MSNDYYYCERCERCDTETWSQMSWGTCNADLTPKDAWIINKKKAEKTYRLGYCFTCDMQCLLKYLGFKLLEDKTKEIEDA